MTEGTSDVSSQEFDPELMNRKLNISFNMSVVSDLSDAYDLDAREFDNLATDIHCAIVGSGTSYGDLGNMSQTQATAFLPDDGSIGEDLIDNAGFFPDAPEAIVDIEDNKFKGHTQKIPKYQSQSMKYPITPEAVPRRKHGSKGSKVSKKATETGHCRDLGGMAQEKGGAFLRDGSISSDLDADLFFGKGPGERQSPVSQVDAFHSSLGNWKTPVTPKAATPRRHMTKQMPAGFLSVGNLKRPNLLVSPRRHVTKQMHAGFHSAGNLNRPKLSFGSKGRKKVAQNPIHEDLSDVGTYGDLGGLSKGKATSFLPDLSDTSLLDEGIFLVDSPERLPVISGESMLSRQARLEPPKTPQERRRASLSEDMYSPGSRKPKALKSSKGRKGSKSETYGDLKGMSQAKVTSFHPDHSISELGDLGALFLLDIPPESRPLEALVKKIKKPKSQQGRSSQPKANVIDPDQLVSELNDPSILILSPENSSETREKSEPKSLLLNLHHLELPMALSPQGAAPRRVGSKQSLSLSNLSLRGRRGKVGNSNSNQSVGKRNGTEIPDESEGGVPTEAGTYYGDLGGLSGKIATSFLPDHSISDLGGLTLFLGGNANANEMDQFENSVFGIGSTDSAL